MIFESQPIVPNLALNESHSELLLLPGKSGAGLQDSLGVPAREGWARGSCTTSQDPHLLVHHIGLQSWEAWRKLMGLVVNPLFHIMALTDRSKEKQPTPHFLYMTSALTPSHTLLSVAFSLYDLLCSMKVPADFGPVSLNKEFIS